MTTELTVRAHLQAAIACFPQDLHAGWELGVANNVQAAIDKLDESEQERQSDVPEIGTGYRRVYDPPRPFA